MKTLSILTFLALASLASAAPDKKVASKPAPAAAQAPDLAFASTWLANAQVLVGKSMSTCIQEVLDIGNVTSNAPCVVVPVITGNQKGDPGGQILALVPLAETEAFVKNATSSAGSKDTKFGNNMNRAVTTGTLAVVEGELVFVIGPSIPALGNKKPSALLAEQLGRK